MQNLISYIYNNKITLLLLSFVITFIFQLIIIIRIKKIIENILFFIINTSSYLFGYYIMIWIIKIQINNPLISNKILYLIFSIFFFISLIGYVLITIFTILSPILKKKEKIIPLTTINLVFGFLLSMVELYYQNFV